MSRISPKLGADALIKKQVVETLERSAKGAGYSLVTEYATCEMGFGFALLTAPIAREETPTDKELTKGIDLLYAYVAFPGDEKLKPGFYVIRIATSGYDFKAGAKVSLVDSDGKIVRSVQATTKPLGKGPVKGNPGFDEFAVRSINEGEVCGRKKCFHWKRIGLLTWEIGCTDGPGGNVVNCL